MKQAPGFIVFLEETDTTQSMARLLAEQGAEEGATVVARHQTAGRGRRGRSWLSTEGALAASMVLRPRCSASEAPRITLGAAAGLLDAFDAIGIPALVKWPNDVVIPSAVGPHGRLGPYRKVAGVIVEVVRMTDTLECAVLGVGVNLRSPAAGWPEDLRTIAGSLSDHGFTRSLEWVLPRVRSCIFEGVDRALRAFPEVLTVLRARSATLGRVVEIVDDHGVMLRGMARSILEDGTLAIETDDGSLHQVRAGDVGLAPPPVRT